MDKVERTILGGLIQFSKEELSFCVKTFPVLTETTTDGMVR